MAKREKNEQLQALFDAGANVYSISKANVIERCLYEAYNTYVLHKKGASSVYGILGGRVHDKLEEIIHGKAETSELLPALHAELDDLDMLGIDFQKDFRGNTSIRDNYIADMTHFCNTFIPPKGDFETEKFFLYQFGENRYIQGYIDLVKKHNDSTVSVYDWKTSGKFKTEELPHHGRQLALYVIALEAMGFKVKETAWIMLKYCEVSYMGKKRANSKEPTPVTKIIRRGELIKELRSTIEYYLDKEGFSEIDIECIMAKALEQNSLKVLPENVQNIFTIRPYVQKYEITDEVKAECLAYMNSMADRFEVLDASDEKNFPPKSFTKTNSAGKEVEDTYFCNVLCSHRESCKHIKRHREDEELKKNAENAEDDLF